MNKITSLIFSLSLVAGNLVASTTPVEVQNVSFRNLVNNWTQIEIQLLTNENTLSFATTPNFVQNVNVELILAYPTAEGFEFFKNDVDILVMERGDRPTVNFFLAGPIAKMLNLPSSPFAYMVNVSVMGQQLPHSAASLSSSIRTSTEALNSLQANAQTNANKSALLPSFHAPVTNLRANIRNEPIFIRE